jgi:Meiotically up-regulated gene 113
MVYFIQGTKSGNIKIGFSGDPYFRISQLRTGASEPLVMLGMAQGTRRDEKNLHVMFCRDRIDGEWFKYSERLAEVIDKSIISYETAWSKAHRMAANLRLRSDMDRIPEQVVLTLPGWRHIEIPAAVTFYGDIGRKDVQYVDMTEEDFAAADESLTQEIKFASAKRIALRAQNGRLIPLRARYGDLKVRDLISRALDDYKETGDVQEDGIRA